MPLTVVLDIEGKGVRYEPTSTKIDLPKHDEDFAIVYEIDSASVFYRYAFCVNSDNIMVAVEIDGQNLFDVGGIKLEDLEDMDFGKTGGNCGQGESGQQFGFYQYRPNKWIWEPPYPLKIDGNMKIKMRASDNKSSRDFNRGIAIRSSA